MATSRTPPGLKRGRKKRAALLPEQVTGRKYLQILSAYLHRLHAAYPHPNRVLFYDDVVVSYLVAFFSPAVRSLRLIENASQVPGVNQYLNVESVCSSTLSDANALFDPVHLVGLIADLRKDLPGIGTGPGVEGNNFELRELLDSAVLVDGSFFRLAADVQWAIHAANQYGGGKGTAASCAAVSAAAVPSPLKKSRKIRSDKKERPRKVESAKPGIGTLRMNCQFCLASGAPVGVSVNGSDGVHESAAAQVFVEPGHLYLFDSGIVSFDYLSAILSSGSHLLCNLAVKVNFTAEQNRELTAADLAAGVISDRVGSLGGSRGSDPPRATLREIIIQYTDREGNPRHLRLLTDLLNLSAADIAQVYRQRWKIELFFRDSTELVEVWLKVSANFIHLTSHSKNGVTLSFHIAVIAALLMILRTGRELSVHGYQLLGLVASGQADIHDILPILEYRDHQRRLERERLARKRAAKKPA